MIRPTLRLTSVALLCLTACHSGGVDGQLRVRTGVELNPSDQQNTVVLGDGTRFTAALDPAGTAVFSNPDLSGPVDVSWVRVKADGTVSVITLLAIDQPEVVFLKPPGTLAPAFGGGTVTGKVLGVPDGGVVSVEAIEDGPGAEIATAQSDGTFSVGVLGDGRGPVDLVALLGTSTAPTEIGLLRNVPPTDGGTVSGQEVALERPITSMPVHFQHAELYPQLPDGGTGSPPAATLRFSLDGAPVFATVGDTSTPVETFDRSPPYDVFSAMAYAMAGDEQALPNGSAFVREPVAADAQAVEVTFPDPLQVVAPALGTADSPAQISQLGELQWAAEPSAQFVTLHVVGDALAWTVYAPADATGFRPFTLPASVSPVSGFTSGLLKIQAQSTSDSENGTYEERFSPDAGKPAGASHGSQLQGWVRIQ